MKVIVVLSASDIVIFGHCMEDKPKPFGYLRFAILAV